MRHKPVVGDAVTRSSGSRAASGNPAVTRVYTWNRGWISVQRHRSRASPPHTARAWRTHDIHTGWNLIHWSNEDARRESFPSLRLGNRCPGRFSCSFFHNRTASCRGHILHGKHVEFAILPRGNHRGMSHDLVQCRDIALRSLCSPDVDIYW